MTTDEYGDEQTCEIVRFYEDRNRPAEVLETGVPLAEAIERCEDTETSSKTATGAEAERRTSECGPWFEGWRRE